MKHLKKYKLFESTKSIDDICENYGIKNYTINPDGTIDVDGDVNLSHKRLSKLPIKFGHVTGSFWCYNNRLTTLEGCPRTVGGSFWCYNNQLTTLEGCPKTVGGSFLCHNNQLTSLEVCPTEVGGDFWCYNNRLTILEGAPKSVGGDFWCNNNQLTTLEGCPSTVGRDFWCHYNKLLTLEGLTDVSIGGGFIYKDNPIYKVTKGWLINEDYPDMDRIGLFNDISVVVGNKLYLPKLEYFHEEIGVPLPNLDEIKKYYDMIE